MYSLQISWERQNMPKFKFVLARTAIIDEYYDIEADSEEEALEIAQGGDLGDPVKTEFLDWYSDEFQVCDKETIEPLYRMVKDYDPDRI